MASPLSWLLSWLLNEVTGCGGARTEPSNFDFVVAVESWPSPVPCLPAIVYDCVMYLIWQHLSLQWLRVCGRSGDRPPENHDTLGQRKTCILPDAHLRLLHNLARSCGSSLIEYLGSLLKIRILEMAPPVVALSLVVPPYFAKPILVLSLI